MKKRNKKIMAVFMALTLTSTIVPAYSYNVWAGEKENNANISVIPQGLILEKENIDIEEGNTYDLTNETGGDMVQALEEGTIIVSFTSTGTQAYQSLISAGNSTNGNRNRYFHLYITDTGALGMELRNTDENIGFGFHL